MSSEWLKLKLGELCAQQGGAIMTGPFGSQLHTADYRVEGTPVVMPTNIVGSRVAEDGIARIDKADVERLSQHKLRIGDLVFSRRGDVTKSAFVRAREVGWLCGTGCLKVRLGNESLASAEFVSYYMQLPEIKEWLIQHAVGATMPNLNTGILSAVPLILAPPETQKKIVHQLSALDASILTLQQQNTTLESIVQTLFRSWFVDFDPVHAKAAGNAPEAMSGELAKLFPSEFENSELGLIPKGWAAGKLNSICELNPESWSASRHPAILNYVDLSGLKKNVLLASERYSWSDAPSRARRVLRKGDSLYGTVRPGNLSYGYIGANSEALTGSTGFAVLRPKELESAEFVYCAMTLRENIERLTHLAEGAAYPAVRADIVHEQELTLPKSEVLKAFHRVTSPLFEQITINSRIAAELVDLRDHLLPRLISGKLRLEYAEASVAAITSGLDAGPA